MMGILLAFRRLATSSELDVMRGVGLSYTRLLRVPYAYAIVLAALNFAIVSFVQPTARYAYEGLKFELRSGALGAAIKVGEFNRLGERLTIRVEQSAGDGQRLSGLFVELRPKDGTTVTATAQSGEFLQSGDADTVLLRLADGVLVQEGPELAGPRVLTFKQQDLPIQLPRTEAFRARGEQNREFTLPELVRQSRTGATERERDESLANLNFRLAEVAMTLLLPLLAVALAVPPKRSSSALGVFLSIIFVVTYYKVNEYMEGVGASGAFDPVLALWAAVRRLRRADCLAVLDTRLQGRWAADRRAGDRPVRRRQGGRPTVPPARPGVRPRFFPSRELAFYLGAAVPDADAGRAGRLAADPADPRPAGAKARTSWRRPATARRRCCATPRCACRRWCRLFCLSPSCSAPLSCCFSSTASRRWSR